MGNLGFGELLLILLVVLLIFGSSKLPQLGDALGRGIRNFRRATADEPPAKPDATLPKPDATPLKPDAAPLKPDVEPGRK